MDKRTSKMFQDRYFWEDSNVKPNDYRLDMTAKIKLPEAKLLIGGVEAIYTNALTLIGAQRKQGKSNLIAILAAVMLGQKSFGVVERGNDHVDNAVWFDTEQSTFFQRVVVQRIYNICNIREDYDTSVINLDYYGLSGVSYEKRLRIINDVVEQKHPALVIIDQIGDLVGDPNDATASYNLFEMLAAMWRKRNGLSIIATLHDNPGGEKARGHLGTLLEHKAAQKFNIIRGDNGIFTVINQFSRSSNAPNWNFRFDSYGNLEHIDQKEVATIQIQPREIIPTGDPISFSKVLDNFIKVCQISKVQRPNARLRLSQLLHDWELEDIITKRDNKYSLNT